MKRPAVWLESTHTLSSRGRGRDGVGHYTEELIAHVAAADPGRRFTVVGNVFATATPKYPHVTGDNVGFRLSRWFPGKVWNQLFKRGLMPPLNWIIPGKPDLVVFFNFVRYPLTRGVRSIVTIHDLTFEHYPDQVQARNQRYLHRFVPLAVAKADHLVAVSEYTKRDLHERYGVPLDKISVVSPGVDLDRYRPGLDAAAVRAKHGLPERYILRVSTVEPRKNDLTLIKAYRALPEPLRRKYALVIAGKVGWRDETVEAVLREIERGDEAGRIIYRGYVEDADMPGLYAGAAAFALASHFEGFGMPALEAMACGIPVITSDNSSLPELVKGAGIMVPADDYGRFAHEIERVLGDPKLHAELGAKARRRAEKFSWEASGRQLKAAIDKALSV